MCVMYGVYMCVHMLCVGVCVCVCVSDLQHVKCKMILRTADLNLKTFFSFVHSCCSVIYTKPKTESVTMWVALREIKATPPHNQHNKYSTFTN